MNKDSTQVRHSYAQTNLQLFNQMLAGGYSDADVELVRRCHGLVLYLFTGHYRGNGKPFLIHLIGTASILAAIEAPIHVVCAGLLHAAYEHGDFGIEFPFSRRRARVRRSDGQEVEELVACFSKLEWIASNVPSYRRDLHTMAPIQRDVLLIRLANELEDSLDSGLLYCLTPHKGQVLAGPQIDELIELARELEQPGLAGSLRQAADEYHTGPPPPDILRSPTTTSYTVVSPSYGMRPSVRVGRTVFTFIRPALDRLYRIATTGDREL